MKISVGSSLAGIRISSRKTVPVSACSNLPCLAGHGERLEVVARGLAESIGALEPGVDRIYTTGGSPSVGAKGTYDKDISRSPLALDYGVG